MAGSMSAWSATCPAKVNLFLRILAREDTGFHQIETLFQAVSLCDRVEARPGRDGISFEVRRNPRRVARRDASDSDKRSGDVQGSRQVAPGDVIGDLGDPEDNTVVKAARVFFAETGIAPAVSLVLTKSIPAGTGLGGGSSDAAGTLAVLNAMHGAPLSAADLIAAGGRIGSDVPFFCSMAATALAWGRGDRLLRCSSPPAAPIVLAIPGERVSTATAYRETSSALELPAPAGLLRGAGPKGWPGFAVLQWNDFERAVFARLPALAEVRAALAAGGASVARLAGSGSAVFGVFGDAEQAHAAADRVRTMDGVAAATVAATLTAMPSPRRTGDPADA